MLLAHNNNQAYGICEEKDMEQVLNDAMLMNKFLLWLFAILVLFTMWFCISFMLRILGSLKSSTVSFVAKIRLVMGRISSFFS